MKDVKRQKTVLIPMSVKNFLPFFGIAVLLLSVLFLVFRFFGKWDGNERYNIIIADSSDEPIERRSVYIYSVEPHTESAVFIRIPGNTLVDVPFGYSLYPISSVYRLGEMDKKGTGGKLLLKSAEISLGVLINGYIVVGSDPKILSGDDIRKLKKGVSLSSVVRNIPSYFSAYFRSDRSEPLPDMYQLLNSFKNIRTDKIKFLDLEITQSLLEEKLPDGSISYTIDPETLDSEISMMIYDTRVRNEKITFEVSNASDRNKLASRFGRILMNTGANVLLKSTAKSGETESCRIIGNSKDYESYNIIKKLTSRYGCTYSSDPGANETTDVKIILGEDFMK